MNSVPEPEPRDAMTFATAEFGTRHRDTNRRTRGLWAIGSLILAVGALVVPDIDNRTIIAAALAATIPLNLLWHRVLPNQYNEHTRPVFEGLVVLGLAIGSPSTWLPALFAYAVSLAISARDRMPPAYLRLHVLIIVSMAIVGAVQDVPFWLASILTLTVLVVIRWFEPRWVDRVIADRAELAEAQTDLLMQAVTDPVTGLANRRALIDQLTERLRLAGRESTGLLMMDLDRFKQINDTLGHAVGDRALKLIGDRLVVAVSPHRVCRLGGDEFAVVVEDPELLPELVVAIHKACIPPVEIGPMRLSIDVSMGSAVAPGDGNNASKLMRCSDLAMYHAKRQNLQHVSFGRELAAMSVEEFQLSARVAEGLQREEFELWYQPKVDLRSGAIVGVEALARWRHPERGLLRPASFIQLVTLSHVQRAFTDAVLHSSALMAAALAGAGYDVPVSINLPMHELMRHDLVRRLKMILKCHKVAASQITIEVTEDTIMDDDRAIADTVRELDDAGFSLSIDDFGTGLSSFERLVDLPVRELKIDRSFVIAAVGGKKERAVVESIVDLGQRLHLAIVAEGVETTRERALMRSIGCTAAQGYHWCRPMPGPDLIDFVVYNGGQLDPAA